MNTPIKLTRLHSALNRNFTLAFIVACSCITSSFANAETAVAGKTLLAKGSVNAINPTTAERRILKRRSKIFSVDNIMTGANSKAQFSMADGGLITLKENTEINVSNYEYDKKSKQGSATLEVISGGLRSISGLIKKSGGDYQVKTPVGSIGIRGTHFAVNVTGNNVLFGVFSGNIDIKLNNNETLSLGVTEGFAFASVNELGEVTPLTQAPEALTNGFTSSSTSSTEKKSSTKSSSNPVNVASINADEVDTSISTLASNNSVDVAINPELYTESEWQDVDSPPFEEIPIADLISERSGTFNYQQITQSDVTSSAGSVSDFTMNMAIDFDNGTVPGGSLSFSDAQGEWFATYSGLINIDKLALGINFASHENQKADGDISAAFSNGIDELIGRFELHEIEDPTIQAKGSFKIK